MTLVDPGRTGPVAVVRSRWRWRRVAGSPVLLALALAAVAFAIRSVGLTHSFELLQDEMWYADLGASASRGEMPRLADDGVFFLHPPGFFLLEGGVIRLLNIPTGDSMSLVFDLRWLNATLGALTIGLVFLLIRAVAGTWMAAWGALVLAFEPFALRVNSRVILEPLAELMLVAGMLILVRHVQRPGYEPRARFGHPWSSTARLLAGGLLLGCAVFTKDAYALFAVAPVLLAVVWRRTVVPDDAAVVLAGSIVPYASYLVVVTAAGYWEDFRWAKLLGVSRAVGTIDLTGFNAPGAPSLLGRLVAEVEHYGTSYVILLLCPLAGLVAMRSALPERRLLGLTALVPGVYGVYMVAFGTSEEQYAYPILVAGAIALAVVMRMVLDRAPTYRTATVALLTLFVLAAANLGTRQELTRDDGMLTFRGWAAQHLPPTVKVGVTTKDAAYAFKRDSRFGRWPTRRLLELHNAQYVLTFGWPTRQGYTLATPELLDWLDAHAIPVFRTYGPTNGNTVLWSVDARDLPPAATQSVGDPPGTRRLPGDRSHAPSGWEER